MARYRSIGSELVERQVTQVVGADENAERLGRVVTKVTGQVNHGAQLHTVGDTGGGLTDLDSRLEQRDCRSAVGNGRYRVINLRSPHGMRVTRRGLTRLHYNRYFFCLVCGNIAVRRKEILVKAPARRGRNIGQ